MGAIYKYVKYGLKSVKNENSRRRQMLQNKKEYYDKSVGYHGFNLYAFALLYINYPGHDIWRSKKIRHIIDAPRSDAFIASLKNNEFGYFYNLSGIEIAYAIEQFIADPTLVQWWLAEQFAHTYNDKTAPTVAGAPDCCTAKARIYQACRLNQNSIVTRNGT
jgi:hypothetical protein